MDQHVPRSMWPGHVPGRFYFGMTRNAPARRGTRYADQPTAELEEMSYGAHRLSLPWGQWQQANRAIAIDHARHRLPWISIRPPLPGVHGWQEVAGGVHDHAIYAFGRGLAVDLRLPVILSFGSDPSSAGAEPDGRHWIRAYCRFHDIIAAATDLRLIAEAPLVDDWLFNPANPRQDPTNWLTDDVLDRASLLGVNVFENASGEAFERRIPRILDWLDDRGFSHTMVGVAGSGRTEYAPPYIAPDRWLNDSLDWAAKHTDRVGVVCYSSSPEDTGVYWPADALGRFGTRTASWTSRAITTL